MKHLDAISTGTPGQEVQAAHAAIKKKNPIEYTLRLSKMLDKTHRSGARSNGKGPAIFPNGLRAAMDTIDLWTPKGTLRKGPKEQPKIKDDRVQRDTPPLELLLPYHYCASCDNSGKTLSEMAYGDFRMVGFNAGLEHLRVYPGHMVQYYMCKLCDAARKTEVTSSVLYDSDGNPLRGSIMYKWAEKSWENAKRYINYAYSNKIPGVFVGRELRGEPL